MKSMRFSPLPRTLNSRWPDITARIQRVVILRIASYGPYAPKKRTFTKLSMACRRSAKNRTYCSAASFEIAYGRRGDTGVDGDTGPASPSYTAPDDV